MKKYVVWLFFQTFIASFTWGIVPEHILEY